MEYADIDTDALLECRTCEPTCTCGHWEAQVAKARQALDADARYEAALEAMALAERAYEPFRVAYRARLIGDDVYLAARRARDAAEAVFDAEFDIAARREA